MSSIAHTQPRTGRRKFNLRAYLAGTAATAALIGAVVLAFVSLGAYVAFNGLPVGGSDSGAEAGSVAVGPAAAAANTSGQRTSQNTAPAERPAVAGLPGGRWRKRRRCRERFADIGNRDEHHGTSGNDGR